MRGDKRPLPAPLSAELVQPEKVDAKLNASIHNRFDVEVIDSRTGEVRQRAQGENVICDALWPKLIATDEYSTLWLTSISIGNGVGVPKKSDKTLFSHVSSYNVKMGSYGRPDFSTITETFDEINGVYSLKNYITINELQDVGVNITEVGVGSQSSIYTHAMLKDMSGNQIQITKTNTDIIHIYATIFVHFNAPNAINKLFGNPYELLRQIAGSGGYNLFARLSPRLINNGSNYVNLPAGTVIADALNKTIKFVGTRLSAEQFNYAGGAYGICMSSSSAGIFLSSLTANCFNVVGENIGTGDGNRISFETKFGFIKQGSAKVYLNGVEATNVNVLYDCPHNGSFLGAYFLKVTSSGEICDYIFSPVFSAPLGANYTLSAKEERFGYNKSYKSMGLCSFYRENSNIRIFGSDDFKMWVELENKLTHLGNNIWSIPIENQGYKYWKLVNTSASYANKCGGFASNKMPINFTQPPPVGSVITVDYSTSVIPKDANHVFDFSCELQFGEYTPPVV